MAGNGDEPDSAYGLLASSVKYSADKLDYSFDCARRRVSPTARG